MNDWKRKLKMRLPVVFVLAATLLFWGFYDRYELADPILLQAPALADASLVRGDCIETNGRFVLNVDPGGKPARINFRIPTGTEYEYIRIRGRIKTDGVVVGKYPWSCARLMLLQYGAKNKWIPGDHAAVVKTGTHDWTSCEDVFEIEEQAVHVDLVVQQRGLDGTAEFDQLVAEPVRLRISYVWWQALFACLWVATGVLYYRRCRLHRRRLRLLILINAIAIVAGALMPGQWIEDTADYAKEETVRLVEATRPQPVPGPKAPTHTVKKSVEEQKINEFSELVVGVHGFGHFSLFASLCFLVYLSAALERQQRGYYFKVAFDILLFAAVTESLQYLTLDRAPGISDWLTDVYGMVSAFVLFVLVKRYILSRSRRIKSSSF